MERRALAPSTAIGYDKEMRWIFKRAAELGMQLPERQADVERGGLTTAERDQIILKWATTLMILIADDIEQGGTVHKAERRVVAAQAWLQDNLGHKVRLRRAYVPLKMMIKGAKREAAEQASKLRDPFSAAKEMERRDEKKAVNLTTMARALYNTEYAYTSAPGGRLGDQQRREAAELALCILLMYYGALRISEALELRHKELVMSDGFWRIAVRKSKVDQAARGVRVEAAPARPADVLGPLRRHIERQAADVVDLTRWQGRHTKERGPVEADQRLFSLNYQTAVKRINVVLRAAGATDAELGTHGYRRAAAVVLATPPELEEAAKKHGRWSSGTVRQYTTSAADQPERNGERLLRALHRAATEALEALTK